ncbi:MAG TPA: hypothetical protein VGF95_10920 [Solirubrobacteraceae bacterium]|jgi:hypothetical protein
MPLKPTPLVVQYLYVHAPEESFLYPTARSDASAARLACRYLECAIAQAASLRLRDVDCELALATNLRDPSALGRAGVARFEQLDALGVQILHADYRHRPAQDVEMFMSSRYVLDAILAAVEGQPDERQLWLVDLDCVWPNAQLVFGNAPQPGQIGAIDIPYPPDWMIVEYAEAGRTRSDMSRLASELGGAATLPPWIGGELLSGTPPALRALVATCEALDARLAQRGQALPAEEQVLTLAGALGLVDYCNLTHVAQRVWTGPRHGAPPVENALSLGFWHVPAEKGLSLRRAANAIAKGRTERLRRDLADPARMASRFNVQGTGLRRRLQDDGWIAMQHARGRLHAAAARLRPRSSSRAS